MATNPFEAFKYLTDFHQMFSAQKREKATEKMGRSLYFGFAFILFDGVSTGQDMLLGMAISLHHMRLSQDSRAK